ncbi:MAG TPA: flagellar export chaperone FliS [Syntrophomonadaceae bacterium]|nr:flagellar export chaperone FliS [Syntrophomonadaceae bacterium]
MSMNAQVYNQYKKATVETVSSGKLLLMLYDGTIKNLNSAINEINEKDYNKAHNNIIKTQDIIVELMSTLNMDYEISKNLYSLYDFWMSRLIEANVNKDADILAEVAEFFKELRDTWEEVIKTQSNVPNKNAANSSSLSLKG